MLIKITQDATNHNNVRIHTNMHGQLCKVYGWNSEEAMSNATMIAEALTHVSGPAVAKADVDLLREWLTHRKRDYVRSDYNDALERVLDHFS